MSEPVYSEVNLDGDLVAMTLKGSRHEVYACDVIDEIHDEIERRDKESPLPPVADQETGDQRKQSHGDGLPFALAIVDVLKGHGVEVRPNRAVAIYAMLSKKAVEFRESFENGRSSRQSSESPLPVSSADARVSALLSNTDAESAPKKPSNDSTTE